ncbi:MAG TPA: carboxypeptidase-like regulatory domain-containing protein, partial [Blastocatellia bacterium]|nr:carboxypeptidase-like regulatory domain-containing protein [Blastocatellia bacterium]
MKIKLFNRKCLLSVGLAVGLLLVTQTALAEQPQSSNSQVRIVVQDETGALVAGATVQLKLNDTVLRVLNTDEKGVAVADDLQAGDYEVTVSKDGF